MTGFFVPCGMSYAQFFGVVGRGVAWAEAKENFLCG